MSQSNRPTTIAGASTMSDGGPIDVPSQGSEPERAPSSTPGGPTPPPPTAGATPPPEKTTREIARDALLSAGLSKPPKSSGGARRLVVFSTVVLVGLVVVVAGSLIALDHLKTTVTVPSSTTTTAPSTSTTTTSTTIPSASGAPKGVSPLVAYGEASADGDVLAAVGPGGEEIPFVETKTKTFITDPSAAPVVVYWWNGTCAPCAAENLVVVSSLDALGGTFKGLSTTTETGGITTIDLRHASYHGPIVFEAAEVDGPTGRPDQPYGAQAAQQFQSFDQRPYTKDPGAYPFLDVGGHFVEVGPAFASALLQGLTIREIAKDLATPSSAVTRSIDGSANELTAAICRTLNLLSQRRPLICANQAIAAIEPGLPTAPPT
jgi:hypothetical protein